MNQEILNAAEKIFQTSLVDGVQSEILVNGSDSVNLGFKKGNLEKYEMKSTQVIGIRVIKNGLEGTAFTENPSQESLKQCYREALANAQSVSSGLGAVSFELPNQFKLNNDWASLADEIKRFQNDEPLNIEHELKLAKELESLALLSDSRVKAVPYSGYSRGLGRMTVLNSHGLVAEQKMRSYSGYSYVHSELAEQSKMDGESFFTRNFADIHVEKIVKKAVEKSLGKLGSTSISSGRYTVVFHPDVMPSVVAMLAAHLDGQDIIDGVSLLKGKLGDVIASSQINIIDDPTLIDFTGFEIFDSEGTVKQKTNVIENGILRNIFTHSATAAKLGFGRSSGHAQRSPTTNMSVGNSNWVIGAGDAKLNSMLNADSKVILITDFSGSMHSGYKQATGDFSMPFDGILYEKGQKVRPIDQVVVSGNIFDLLKNISAVSDEVHVVGQSAIAPYWMAEGLSIAGQ